VPAVGVKNHENQAYDGNIDKVVHSMANVAALQHSLPRLFRTLMRGMCHVGMIRSDQLIETFQYAEATLKGANKACDKVGSMYSLEYEICRNKFGVCAGGFSWVQKGFAKAE
jgi:exocyst complex component 6